jgi:hypothetical protein
VVGKEGVPYFQNDIHDGYRGATAVLMGVCLNSNLGADVESRPTTCVVTVDEGQTVVLDNLKQVAQARE